jgi:hypothetical protein
VRQSPKKAEETAQSGGSRLSDHEARWKDQTLEPAAKRRLNGLPRAAQLD